MNTPVSFELAKSLKEKGFDEPVHQYYEFIRDLSSKQDKTWVFKNSSFLVREFDAAMFPDEGKNGVEVFAYSDRIYRSYNFKTSEDFISAPTIAEVVIWLYEKHGIWIECKAPNLYHRVWYCLVVKINISTDYEHCSEEYQSPTEAYEAAIEYCLTKLL